MMRLFVHWYGLSRCLLVSLCIQEANGSLQANCSFLALTTTASFLTGSGGGICSERVFR
jgi:hypothetical protein